MARKNSWYDPSLNHHTREGFRNLEPDLQQQGDLQRWRRERKQNGMPRPLHKAMNILFSSGGNLPI